MATILVTGVGSLRVSETVEEVIELLSDSYAPQYIEVHVEDQSFSGLPTNALRIKNEFIAVVKP